MQAVNLIPDDARRGGGAGAAGRSGGAAYVLLAGLAALVLLGTLWALAGRDVSQARVELAQLHKQAADAQRQAQLMAPYGNVGQQRAAATAAVRGLVGSRFAWSRTLDSFARILPADVRLSTLTGTTPGSAPIAGTAATPAPAAASGITASGGVTVQLAGCAPSMARVARLMPRLRAIPGVDSVTLGTAAHPVDATSATTAAGPCSGATFQMSVVFAAATPAATTPAPAAATTAPGATK